ncbi:hypothetical protein ACF061_12070 [Streptomyces sp. NPDC015220]|uniref:hypothetical protein n=1 Tax=Streptomyces sp. NPDC015220 TaxID=3364947 RepID=UPI0036FFFCE9
MRPRETGTAVGEEWDHLADPVDLRDHDVVDLRAHARVRQRPEQNRARTTAERAALLPCGVRKPPIVHHPPAADDTRRAESCPTPARTPPGQVR